MQQDGRMKQVYDITHLDTRTLESIENDFNLISSFVGSGTQLQNLRTETGVKFKSCVFQLASLVPYISFPIDIIHLLYNISRDIISIWLNESYAVKFSISTSKVRFIDAQLETMSNGLPSSISLPPKPLSSFRSWKAIDHKNFCLSYSQLRL